MPLTGRKVLEIADEKGVYCGKLFADLGAEVIKIESIGGDATRNIPPFTAITTPTAATTAATYQSLFFLYMNTGKKSITVDMATPEGQQQVLALAQDADLIIETLPPGKLAELGLSYQKLSSQNKKLVLTSITGFGQTGPYKDFKSSDIVASAMSGAMMVIGDKNDPPVKLAGSQAFVMASTLAAASSMIALYHSQHTGQGQQVDISAQEAMLAVSSICGVGKWLEDDIISQRYGAALFAAVPSGTYPCKDGNAYLIINRPLHWLTLARWVNEVTGNQEILDPMFEGPSSVRQEHRELLDLFISELSQQLTVDEFYREGQRRHLAITPISTARSITQNRHLHARGFFTDVLHVDAEKFKYPGAPYHFFKTPWQIRHAAPFAGEHNNTIKPTATLTPQHAFKNPPKSANALEGLRVIEFTAGMAGPWIGRFMAYCGADVIKVESKKYPDVTRLYIPPKTPELGIQSQLSPWLTDWNAGKRFVSLDLNNPDAIKLAKELIKKSDIVIDNNGPGVLEKLGLGFDDLQQIKPELILFSSTGFGKHGPDANYISWGPNIETLSGLSHLSGFAHRDCTMTQFAYPDPLAALHGLFAIMSAIDHRDKTGVGQCINMSQLEATIATIGDIILEQLVNNNEPQKTGNASLYYAHQGCYRCAGADRWCVISIVDEQEWQQFCKILDKPEWFTDVRFINKTARVAHQSELDALIESQTCTQDAYTIMHRLQHAGIAAGVVQNVADQWLRDPHLQQRHFFESIPHHKKGVVQASGIPVGLTATPGKTSDAGRARGSDNHAVFCELLGLSATDYQQAVASGVIES